MYDEIRWLVQELRSLAGALSAGPEGPLLLAIDQGGHASRAIVVDARGAIRAESFSPISTFRIGHDRVEHDASEIVASIRAALDELAETLGNDCARVVAAGLATQRSSVVCWDRRSGKALSPVLSWQDRRNAMLIERLRDRASMIRKQTGLVLSPHYGASKLRWCLDQADAVVAARREDRLALGPLSSYLLYTLLDERPYVVDPANASRTQLWAPRTRMWSAELAALFDVPIDLLPHCVGTRHTFGHLDLAGRAVPLVVCTGDQSAAPFAFGPIDPATVYLNMGTGAFLQRVGERDDPRLLRSVLYSDAHGLITVQEGTVNGAAGALDWLHARVDIDVYRVAQTLRRSQRAADVPLFLNGVGGVGSPYWCGQLAPRFVGEGDEAAQVQAVLESIAFLICRNLERMADPPLRRVLATGGLSVSDYLCECIAALSGVPVERAPSREATALGLAFLVADQPNDWYVPADVERFMPQSDAALASRYTQWCRLMEAYCGSRL